MKKKSKIKSRKKKTTTTKSGDETEETVNDNVNFESNTLISGTESKAAKPTKGKRKTRKKKITKSSILEKKVEKLQQNTESFDSFLTQAQLWLEDHTDIVRKIFDNIVKQENGLLTFDEFKAVMFDLKFPGNKVELHLLCKLLEKNTGEINYIEINEAIKILKESRETEKRNQEHYGAAKNNLKIFPCPCCKMLIVEPYQQAHSSCVKLELRSLTFDMVSKYPGHLKLTVHTKLPVCGLIQMIASVTGISSTKLAIFQDKTRCAESVLPPNLTIEECGYHSDPSSLREFTLYYDYTVEFTGCPILMSDFYFGQKL